GRPVRCCLCTPNIMPRIGEERGDAGYVGIENTQRKQEKVEKRGTVTSNDGEQRGKRLLTEGKEARRSRRGKNTEEDSDSRPRGTQNARARASLMVCGAVLPALAAFGAHLAGLPALIRVAGVHVATMAARGAPRGSGYRGKHEKTECSNNGGADHVVSFRQGPLRVGAV
ncbi:MAG: hypothetical protein OK436_07040, partial [Thaumarchaeota archaeon]|nr:hypothetical protein [Nitrososphaerota archaeon]